MARLPRKFDLKDQMVDVGDGKKVRIPADPNQNAWQREVNSFLEEMSNQDSTNSLEQEIMGLVQSSSGLGRQPVIREGKGFRIKAETSTYLEIQLDTPMKDENYIVIPSVQTTTHRFANHEIINNKVFRLRVWNASAVNINPQTNQLKISFHLKGQKRQ